MVGLGQPGPDPGRDGRGQGRPRALAARERPARRGGVRRPELRGPLARVPGDRALRPREGRVHRRHGRQAGPARGRAPRHGVPRRDRRRGPAGPAQAPEGARGEAVPPAGRRARPPRGHPADRGHAPGPGRRWCARSSSAATSTSASARIPLTRPAAARARRGHPGPGRAPARVGSARDARATARSRLAGDGRAVAVDATPGRATSASCATCSSARSCSRAKSVLAPARPALRAGRLRRRARGPRPHARSRSSARHIERVLRAEAGHVEAAAEKLGIPRSSLYQKIKKYGIDA